MHSIQWLFRPPDSLNMSNQSSVFNHYILIFVFCTHVLVTPLYVVLDKPVLLYCNMAAIFTDLFWLYLNRSGYAVVSAICFTLEVVLLAFLSNIYLGKESGFAIYFFIMLLFVFLQDFRYSFKVLLALAILTLYICMEIQLAWRPAVYTSAIPRKYIHYLNAATSFVAFIFTGAFFTKTIHRVMRDLLHSRQKALEGVKAKQRFLANMSHEIRTPLNAIIGMTDLALLSADRDELNEYLQIIKDSGRHLVHIINDILDITRIDSERLLLEQNQIEMSSFLGGIKKVFQSEARQRSLEFTLRTDPELPPIVSGDEYRLKQILFNIIGNAIKFTESGAVALQARLDREQTDDQNWLVAFIISDTGIGIPPDKQEAIFENFEQANLSVTRKYGGTGLGLAISRKLARMMGGDIKLSSQPDTGSEFTLTIPFAKAANPASSRTDMAKHDQCDLKGIRILFVEDNLVNQKLGMAILQRFTTHIHLAENGQAALAEFKRQKFDLILMDLEMPVLNGLQATRRIRRWERLSRKQQTPIIAMTAHALQSFLEEAQAAGMNGYITKPIAVLELEKNICAILDPLRQT
ncbi:MAG: response regulator [Leptospiraceae bacterium]|nr:response regulator [Leptospiraceae bacterium]